MDDYKKLQYALISNDLSILKSELENGVNVNFKGEIGQGILHYYVENARNLNYSPKDVIQLFLNSGADINLQSNEEEFTALRIAVDEELVEVCSILLNNGANPNLSDNDGNSPLLEAMFNYEGEDDQREIIEMLLKGGGDVHKENNHGVSPKNIVSDRTEAIQQGDESKEADLMPILKKFSVSL